jgi:hypothetical protein
MAKTFSEVIVRLFLQLVPEGHGGCESDDRTDAEPELLDRRLVVPVGAESVVVSGPSCVMPKGISARPVFVYSASSVPSAAWVPIKGLMYCVLGLRLQS